MGTLGSNKSNSQQVDYLFYYLGHTTTSISIHFEQDFVYISYLHS
jgi:hypothetical protein